MSEDKPFGYETRLDMIEAKLDAIRNVLEVMASILNKINHKERADRRETNAIIKALEVIATGLSRMADSNERR